MFAGSMINVFIGAVVWAGANYIAGAINFASYIGAFGAGVAADNLIHEAQKQVPALKFGKPNSDQNPKT